MPIIAFVVSMIWIVTLLTISLSIMFGTATVVNMIGTGSVFIGFSIILAITLYLSHKEVK